MERCILNKIGILTYHANYNYGACLQAYALQTVIKRFQSDCEIIDFQPASLDYFAPISKRSTHPKEVIKNITRIPYRDNLMERQEKFDAFVNTNLELSSRYSTEAEVVAHAAGYDCIVCGSDQIWNLDGRISSRVYYLNFPKEQRRVAYASSFGDWIHEVPKHESEVFPWIETFDALSMREETGVDYLRENGFDCQFVLDPTLLLTSTDFDHILLETKTEEPYVLLFSYSGAKNAIEITKKLSVKLDAKAICIVPPPRTMFSGIERKLDVGPREFLSLIKNAKCVVTDSFHGTILSIQYKKPFISVDTGGLDTRRRPLLRQLGLDNHFLAPNEIDYDRILFPDFSLFEERQQVLKNKSLAFLKKAIGL